MSDNLRQYRAIRAALIQGYPGEPTGRLVRHLTPLAACISGIVASTSTQLPHIATQATLLNKVQAWNTQRNEKHAKAPWQFTTDDARVKLRRLYPIVST
jgi:hypothetical protein